MALPETGDRPGSGSRIVHGGCGFSELARVGFDNQTLRKIRDLSHIRHLTMHNAA
jgi:hypothetical protein